MPNQTPQDTSESASIFDTRNWIEKNIESGNIAKSMKKDDLQDIGMKVIEEYDIDEASREDWLKRSKTAMKLVTEMLKENSEKGDGFTEINYPLLITASINFSSRAFIQLVKDGSIVKTKVVGKDENNEKADRANRVGTHMNYQLSEQMEDWIQETDQLLTSLPIEGVEYKKTYFNSIDGVNVSEWVRPKDLVINYKAKSLEKAARYTHVIYLKPNDIIERINMGTFLDYDELRQVADFDEDSAGDGNDDDAPHIFYEQHRYLDLDKDGYKEPYIVTVHKQSQKVVRIVARYDIDGVKRNKKGKLLRIKPVHYFTEFPFMYSPDGGVYRMGFGNFIGPLNLSINMAFNELLYSGYLANMQGGFISGDVSIKGSRGGGDVEFENGKFKQVNYSGDDLGKAILALPFKEPSPTLFNLADRVIAAGEKLGSITDPLVGESPGADVPATTTLALIEQGTKIPTGVYSRLYKSFKSEFKKVFRLNRLYLEDEEYFYVNDDQESVAQKDYNEKDCDVIPISNPTEISNTHKMLIAQALMGMLGMGLNDDEIKRRHLEALQVPDIDKLVPEGGTKPDIDPKTMLELQKLDLERDKFELDMFETQFKVMKLHAQSIEHIAKAEAAEIGPQVQIYSEQLKTMNEGMKLRLQEKKDKGNESKQGRTS